MATIRRTWNENDTKPTTCSKQFWFNLSETFETTVSETVFSEAILSVRLDTMPFEGIGSLCVKTLSALFPEFDTPLTQNAFGNVNKNSTSFLTQHQKERAVSEFRRLMNLGWVHLEGDKAFLEELIEKLQTK